MPAPMSHRDYLELDLHGPMLDKLMTSREMYGQMRLIGEDIKNAYVAGVARDTGDLRSTARVRMERSKEFRDRRWETVFEVGNSRVDYAAAVEERDHTLAEVVRALGYEDVVEFF